MSTFPATDLIVDVAKAADPGRQQTALRRLASVSPSSSFASIANDASLAPTPKPASSWRAAGVGLRGATQSASAPMPPTVSTASRAVTTSPTSVEAAKKFEALVLQTFFEAMLPKAEEQYGSGASGGVWRSLMAEQLADKFTASGAVGLSKTIEKQLPAAASSCALPPARTS